MDCAEASSKRGPRIRAAPARPVQPAAALVVQTAEVCQRKGHRDIHLTLSSTAASSSWRRPVFQVSACNLDAPCCQRLRNHPSLRRAMLKGVVCKRIECCLGEPNGQHRGLVCPVVLGDRRRLLGRRRSSNAQHFVRRGRRRLPCALEPLHRPALAVLTYGVLTLAVLLMDAGRKPMARSSAISAAASVPALPAGIRPENPISP